jgi:hypothetical protein
MTIGKIERKCVGVEIGTGINGRTTLDYRNLNPSLRQVGSERASPSAGTYDAYIEYGRHSTFLDPLKISLTARELCAHNI